MNIKPNIFFSLVFFLLTFYFSSSFSELNDISSLVPKPLPLPQPPLLHDPVQITKKNSFLEHFIEAAPSPSTTQEENILTTEQSPTVENAPSIAEEELNEIIEESLSPFLPENKEEITHKTDEPENTIPEQRAPEEPSLTPPFPEKNKQSKSDIYLEEFLKPWEFGDQQETIQLEFENAELSHFISYIEKRFGLTFILDDSLKPPPQGGKSILGTKITFRTHEPLSKKEVWSIFVTFLDIAGLAPQPGPTERVYRIAPTDPKSPLTINKAPLPTFIGVNPDLIPNNDIRIRYVYFVTNSSLDVIKNVIDSMRSSTSAPLIIFPELRAVIMTDKASNIRSMLAVLQELDKASLPETLTVIKLKHTDAVKVAELYKTLMQDPHQQQGPGPRMFPGRKTSTLTLFNEGIRAVIPEPRQNILILLGTRDSVKKVEDFIVREIDKQEDRQFAPLHIIQLKYVEAEAVASILQEAVNFQPETDAAKFGSVRNGDKYFKPVFITPEKRGNRLIINAEYEDYLKIFELIQKIDIEQPQVGIKVLILNIDVTEDKEFGIQLRNRIPGVNGLLGNNVNFQTSGLAGLTRAPIVENPTGTGATRLLGNLVNLVSQNTTPGSTLLTLGSDKFGVWGLLRFFQQNNRLSVVANPFLIASHKYPAVMSFGETRRVVTATTFVQGGPQDSFADLSANLEVNIEPQISYEGLITLQVRVNLEQFTLDISDNGNRTKKEVKTSVLVSDNEILALGGLMKDDIQEHQTQVPILGDIPLVGWLFKNKTKVVKKNSLLILISAEIIPPYSEEFAERFTYEKLEDNKELLRETHRPAENRDPLHRWFFKDPIPQEEIILDQFTGQQEKYIAESQLPALRKKRKKVRKRERRRRVRRKPSVSRSAPGVAA